MLQIGMTNEIAFKIVYELAEQNALSAHDADTIELGAEVTLQQEALALVRDFIRNMKE